MKHKQIVALILNVLAICFLLGIFLKKSTVNMEFVEEGKAIFRYGDLNVSYSLSEQELSLIQEIFNGKKMYKDNPSCGFTDNISIRFNNSQTFCFACDTCPVIYWKEKDKYFKISEKEKVQLYSLLEEYGFFFPCI